MVNQLILWNAQYTHPNDRPTDGYGHKIHPSQFMTYRETHVFHYPSCLCSKVDSYVEALVFKRTTGICRGEYVAECATSTCGYMRKLASSKSRREWLTLNSVNVEKFFKKAYVPAMHYPCKGILVVYPCLHTLILSRVLPALHAPTM